MAMTMTIQEIITTGQAVAKADPYRMSPEAYASVPYGACIGRQGDVYLWKLAALPEDAIEVSPYPQLAPGHTLGSRHCLASLQDVRMFHLKRPGPLDGPILLFEQAGTITHPTHGDIVGIPAGSIVRITYQQMYADTVRRVED